MNTDYIALHDTLQFRSKDDNNSEQEEAKKEEEKNDGCQEDDQQGNKVTMQQEHHNDGYQQEDDRSGELMVTIPVTMPLHQFNQMQVQKSDDISEGQPQYMINISE